MKGFIAAVSNTNIDMIYEGIERIPKLGEEVFSDGFDIQIGGGFTASIIALSRLGVDARLGTFLGKDLLSKFALKEIESNNVKVTNFYDGGASPVTVTSIITFPEDRCFLTYAPQDKIPRCNSEKIYHALSGSTVCMACSGYDDVFSVLKNEGSKVIYDVGWSDDLSVKKIEGTLKNVHIFTPNEREALKMTDSRSLEEAIKIISGYTEHVVITLGKNGCMTMINGEIVNVPALPVFNTVDTTGAGDAFAAGLAYGLYNKWDIVDCMKFGNILGGYSTTQFGCCKAYMTLEKAKEYMELYREKGVLC